MNTLSVLITDEMAMQDLGATIATHLDNQYMIYLNGDLGTGKTTLTRGLLRQLGYSKHVKSPTYTIVEPYEVDIVTIYHIDLYRIYKSSDIEAINFRDYCNDAICIVEWAEHCSDYLPTPDLTIHIHYHTNGRQVKFLAQSPAAKLLLSAL